MTPFAELLLDRHGPANMVDPRIDHDILWGALMVCHDCPHRMIDHDEVAMRCTRCRCDQSSRGLGSRADEPLLALGRAIREAREVAAIEAAPTPAIDRERLARALTHKRAGVRTSWQGWLDAADELIAEYAALAEDTGEPTP